MWWEQDAHMPLNQLQSISTQSYASYWIFASVDVPWFDDLRDIYHPCESFITPGHSYKVQIFIECMFQLVCTVYMYIVSALEHALKNFTRQGTCDVTIKVIWFELCFKRRTCPLWTSMDFILKCCQSGHKPWIDLKTPATIFIYTASSCWCVFLTYYFIRDLNRANINAL